MRSAIYRHFSFKNALIEAIIIKGFEEFHKAISPILIDKSKPLLDRFYLSGKEYIEFALAKQTSISCFFEQQFAGITIEQVLLEECPYDPYQTDRQTKRVSYRVSDWT